MIKETEEEVCSRCNKNKATLTYTDGVLSFVHGFSERICQICYDKMMKESKWYKEGFQQGFLFEEKEFMQQGKFTTSMNRKVCYDAGYEQGKKDNKKEMLDKFKIRFLEKIGSCLSHNTIDKLIEERLQKLKGAEGK